MSPNKLYTIIIIKHLLKKDRIADYGNLSNINILSNGIYFHWIIIINPNKKI